MSTISGTATWETIATVVAASSGDGDTIAAYFSGVVIPGISNTAATATNATGTVTISWPNSGVRVADNLAKTIVTNLIASHTALTAPISINVATTPILAA
jgi:hypothetical protein